MRLFNHFRVKCSTNSPEIPRKVHISSKPPAVVYETVKADDMAGGKFLARLRSIAFPDGNLINEGAHYNRVSESNDIQEY